MQMSDICIMQLNQYKGQSFLPELSNKVMEEDASFQPGQVQSRTKPLPTSKWSEVRGTHVCLLLMQSVKNWGNEW